MGNGEFARVLIMLGEIYAPNRAVRKRWTLQVSDAKSKKITAKSEKASAR